jgi:hypothetical protein
VRIKAARCGARSAAPGQAHEDAVADMAGHRQHGVAVQAAIEMGIDPIGRERAIAGSSRTSACRKISPARIDLT